jgi:hypothetical protein
LAAESHNIKQLSVERSSSAGASYNNYIEPLFSRNNFVPQLFNMTDFQTPHLDAINEQRAKKPPRPVVSKAPSSYQRMLMMQP